MDKENRFNLDFVRFYLISAALILGVTAVGKAIPVHFNYDATLCAELPILRPFQFGISNATVLALASAVEFGIIGLICIFWRQRWLPCLVCSVWGGLCVLVHVISLRFGGMSSCHCLGWFEQVVPLPTEVLGTILLVCAGWLALGGLAAFCFSCRRTRPALVSLALAVICVLAGLAWGIHYYEENPYQNVFCIVCGGVIALSVGLYLRRRKMLMRSAGS